MYYLIYKTTNLLNEMYYIGCHQTDNIHDGYMGSGKRLKRAIKKYGKENFIVEILKIVSSKEEMFDLEKSIVNAELVMDPLSYNLKIGGSGGNPGIVGAFTGRKHTEEAKELIRQASLKQIITDQKRQNLRDSNWSKKDPEAHREHMRRIAKIPKTEEHNRKITASKIGKILINNGIIAKRIDKNDLTSFEEQGWIKGGLPRKIHL